MNYVYKGSKPLTMVRADGHVLTLKPCGTDAAYKRHLSNGEVACEPCLTAHRITIREWDRANNKRPPRKVAKCGTPSAYRRHIRNNEPVDKACQVANAAYTAERRAAIKKEQQHE